MALLNIEFFKDCILRIFSVLYRALGNGVLQLSSQTNSFGNLKLFRGASSQLVPWNSFALLASFFIGAGFAIRVGVIYARAMKSEGGHTTIDAVIQMVYAIIIIAVLTGIDWNQFLNS